MDFTLASWPLVAAASLGLTAGLAVAIPVGPISLLIVDRAMHSGRTVGLAAAAGVASTDLVYAALALSATTWVTRTFAPVTVPATYLAATVIAVIGVRGLLATRRPTDLGHLDDVVEVTAARPAWTFLGFVALTAINPATVLSFTALTLALADRLVSPGPRMAFVVGVGVGSFVWQAVLAAVGAHLGRRPRPSVQRRTRQVGSLVLLLLAGLVAANAT